MEAFKQYRGQMDLSERIRRQFGQQTIACMARGCSYQAAIWEAAWAAGRGKMSDYSQLAFTGKKFRDALQKLYLDPAELRSYHLDTIARAKVLK